LLVVLILNSAFHRRMDREGIQFEAQDQPEKRLLQCQLAAKSLALRIAEKFQELERFAAAQGQTLAVIDIRS
jgi:hypothetical protein